MDTSTKQRFIGWLLGQGCEVSPTTNQWEVLRFKGRETAVYYTSGKTSGPYADSAFKSFMSGKKWNGAPVSTGRHAGYSKQKQTLIERDGVECFYCGCPMGDDITLEHLIPLTAGGQNKISNMVLAHEKCNKTAGVLPISEKVKIAINNRINH